MKKIKLKKCPFCGGRPEIVKYEDWTPPYYKPFALKEPIIKYRFNSCCRLISGDHLFNTKQEVYIVWNKRVR